MVVRGNIGMRLCLRKHSENDLNIADVKCSVFQTCYTLRKHLCYNPHRSKLTLKVTTKRQFSQKHPPPNNFMCCFSVSNTTCAEIVISSHRVS